MYYRRGKIKRIGNVEPRKYDVVYIGDLLPFIEKHEIYEFLSTEYVFLFTTRLDNSNKSELNGNVKIDLIRHDYLSCLNFDLDKNGNFHILRNKPLVINDFLEITVEKTKTNIQIIAELKNQNILDSDLQVKEIKDLRVLLIRGNFSNFINVSPVIELGPEFQLQLKIDKLTEQLFELIEFSYFLNDLMQKKKNDYTKAMQLIQLYLF